MDYSQFVSVLLEFVNNKIIEASELYEENDPTFNEIKIMLERKLNHTIRVTELVYNLSININMHINYQQIVMASGLFHDIGRFNQAIIFKTFNDSISFPNGRNHGDYGFELITGDSNEKNMFEETVIEKYRPAVSTCVLYHQIGVLPKKFNQHITDDMKVTDPNGILTGSYDFNELEQKIISALLHMVRDADKIDILRQRACGDIVPLEDNVTLKNTKNVDEMAKRWGVSKQLILDNNDEDRLSNKSHIILPRKEIPIEKFFVNKELFDRMKALDNVDLRNLQKEDDYTFITALWWCIYTFLKDMNFVSDLELVKKQGLLEQIYKQYPKDYQPLLDEIFKYAKETLIEEQINNSQNCLYVKHLSKKTC